MYPQVRYMGWCPRGDRTKKPMRGSGPDQRVCALDPSQCEVTGSRDYPAPTAAAVIGVDLYVAMCRSPCVRAAHHAAWPPAWCRLVGTRRSRLTQRAEARG